MTVFGDYEPEDAWHPDDDFEDLARNLRNRIRVLDEAMHFAGVWRAYDEEAMVDELQARLQPHLDRQMTHTVRNLRRIEQLQEDIHYLRARAV